MNPCLSKLKKEQRTCNFCGRKFTHVPVLFAGRDLFANNSACDSCAMQRQKEEVRLRRENQAKKMWEACVPAVYRETDINHPSYLKQMPAHNLALQWLKGDTLGQGEKRLCLGLIGDSGLCKTRIVSQMVKRLIWRGKEPFWINSASFQWACQNQFGKASPEADALLRRCRSAAYLVFDDIGSLKASEVVSEGLYFLLEHRTSLGLPVIWTSNETFGEMLVGNGLSQKARKRNISRLSGYSNTLELSLT